MLIARKRISHISFDLDVEGDACLKAGSICFWGAGQREETVGHGDFHAFNKGRALHGSTGHIAGR
jgi:hypothetical protein